MQLRQSARLLAAGGALVLAAPILAGCGFTYATDRVYVPGAANNNQDAQVDVLNGVIVSAQQGSGTFVGSFSNNDDVNEATVTAVSGAGDSSQLQVSGFAPITVPPGGIVTPFETGGIPITGTIAAGDVVTLKFDFRVAGKSESTQMPVSVVPPCHEYEGLDISGSQSASPSSSPSDSPSTSPSDSASASSSSSASSSASPSSVPSISITETYHSSPSSEECTVESPLESPEH
jgi:hypothetical protein